MKKYNLLFKAFCYLMNIGMFCNKYLKVTGAPAQFPIMKFRINLCNQQMTTYTLEMYLLMTSHQHEVSTQIVAQRSLVARSAGQLHLICIQRCQYFVHNSLLPRRRKYSLKIAKPLITASVLKSTGMDPRHGAADYGQNA